MSLRKRTIWLLGFSATACYLVVACWLKATYDPLVRVPHARGHLMQLRPPFVRFGNSSHAVLAPDFRFSALADTSADPEWSTIQLFEDETPIGPAHSSHADILAKGQGRFAHEVNRLYSAEASFMFSSSDNSDPNTNGRSYWALAPDQPARNRHRRNGPTIVEEEVRPIPDGALVFKLAGPFEVTETHHLAVGRLEAMKELADDPEHQRRSPVVIYEDGTPLAGPPHSSHGDIARLGKGRFSHWTGQGVVFSSSDNSNPNSNGRQYWAVLPKEPVNEDGKARPARAADDAP